jgi:hypothetical protein
MSRIRRPEETLLQISQGDWLLVKKRLNAGESRRIFARMVKSIKPGDTQTPEQKVTADVEYDVRQMGLSKAVEYLLDWSIKDDDNKPVVIRDASPKAIESALESLDLESFNEITKAIEDHEVAMTAELEQEKKRPATSSASNPTSVSVEP